MATKEQKEVLKAFGHKNYADYVRMAREEELPNLFDEEGNILNQDDYVEFLEESMFTLANALLDAKNKVQDIIENI